MKKIIAAFLALSMLSSMGTAGASVDYKAKEPTVSLSAHPEQLKNSGPEIIKPEVQISPEEKITAIIVMENKETGISLFGNSNKQKSIQREISEKILDGEELKLVNSYTNVINGFAAIVPYGKLEEIRKIPGVEAAYAAPVFKIAPDMKSNTTVLGGMDNSSGYNGEGMVIAVIDTGIEATHKSFRAAPDSPAISQEDIAAKIDSLRAKEMLGSITAGQVYASEKIPYAFDYADKDTDAAPGSAGDHGVHVSGIAAANDGVTADVTGIAPEAQILAMKVFSSYGSNGASWDDILAAADDAVALGADVINMSLGSTCGFSTVEGDEGIAQVFKNITDSGVMLAVSAGNEYSAAMGTLIGKGHALTANPDYGTVAEPSTYSASMSVASVEKAASINSSYFTAGERKIAYNDTAEDTTVSGVDQSSVKFNSLSGKSCYYEVVPGYGTSEDYEGLDVTGKIALVSRGSVEYNVKKAAAKASGAIGMIVYNNEPGMVYMQLESYDFPCAFISQSDGKWLAERLETERMLTVSEISGEVSNPTSGEMSDFSSWGVTPELNLKPDITAPGGNIKSTTVNNGYTTKSGTSMSSPFIAGAMADVKQYIKQKGLADNAQYTASLVNTLLMNTADIVMSDDNIPYSPRKQGAGSANINNAVKTKAYITVPGQAKPKIELGDDVRKNGSYEMTIELHNLSDEALIYTLGGYVQTDAQEITKQYKGKDVHQVTELPYMLEAEIPSQTVNVPANGTVKVNTAVELTDNDKTYLNSYFENGSYVDGFLTLTPERSGEVTLHVPFMGFYGDWTRASVIDRGFYWNDLNNEENWASQYTNTAGTKSLEGTVTCYLGDNPYHNNIPYKSDRNAISPNGDDTMDALDILYTGLLRNVKELKYTVVDANDPDTVYYEKTVEYEIKSVYDSSYYRIVPTGVQDYSKMDAWYGTDASNRTLPSDTKAIVKIECVLPYEKHAANNERLSWEFPITVDTTAPVASELTAREDNGKYYVDMTVSDNQYVSNITFADASGQKALGSYAVAEAEPGKTSNLSYDVTGYGQNLTVVVNDYAGNRNEYKIKVEGNIDDSEVIVPTKVIFNQDWEGETFPDNGWTLKSQAAKTWYQAYEYGTNMAICDHSSSEQQNEWLISPDLDLSVQETKASMIFDFYTNYYWSVQNHCHNLIVKASSDGGESWEDIWQLWDQKKEFDPWCKTQAKVMIPEKYQNDKAVRFAFVYEGMDGTSLWIDNIQVYVEDTNSVHTITSSAGEGGSIEPSGKIQISDGMDKTFIIKPNSGYTIANVIVDNKSVGAKSSYTFENISEDHTIEAVFAAYGDSGEGVAAALIDEDFEDGVLPDGWSVSSTNSSYTWKVYKYFNYWGAYCSADTYDPDSGSNWGWSVDELLAADNVLLPKNGEKQDERLIMPSLDLNGKTGTVAFQFTGNISLLKAGDMSVALEGSTDNGSTWTELWNAVNGTSEMTTGIISDYVGTGDFLIEIPEAMRTNGVKFAFRYQRPAQSEDGGPVFVDNVRVIAMETGGETPDPVEKYTITASAAQGGNISPNGIISVEKGGQQTFEILPGENYEIADVVVDGSSVGAAASYTFENIDENHVISASFIRKSIVLPESIYEDFNGGLPEDWSIDGPSAKYNYETWKSGRFTDLNSSNVMLCTQNIMFKQEQNEKLILPQINVKSGSALAFDFGGSYSELMSGSIKLTVKVTLDKGETWVELWNAKEHIEADESEPEYIIGKGNLNIPANYCTSDARFAFVFESSDRRNGIAAVDNVILDANGTAAPELYGITIAPMENGTVTADKTVAEEGDVITLTVTPDGGYHLKDGSLMANDITVTNDTFIMPASSVTVTALFEQDVIAEAQYKDGVYRGQATGFNKDTPIVVDVTIQGGVIVDVTVVSQEETESFWKKAIDIIASFLGLGSNDEVSNVDTISSATLSSRGIKNAVLDALSKAVIEDSGIFAAGSGTEQSPYIINNVDQLLAFALDVNSGNTYAGQYIAVGSNITASGEDWIPIGNADHGKFNAFEGVFDGRNYKISNLECGSASEPKHLETIGFFGAVGRNGVVKNLNLSITKFYNDTDSDEIEVYAGGIAGILEQGAVIDHCSVSGGENSISTLAVKENAGGIAGKAEYGSIISNCWSDIGLSTGSMNMSSDYKTVHYTGGICGRQDKESVIANCASFGLAACSVITSGEIHVGGIAGEGSGAVFNCYSMSSTRGNNALDNGTTAVGMLAGNVTCANVFYNCYYNEEANQVIDFTDMAGDPSEGKDERRKVVGTAADSEVEADLTNVIKSDTNEMGKKSFAELMNTNLKNKVLTSASEYFGLTEELGDFEDKLDNGYIRWDLIDSRVLFEGGREKELKVVDVKLIEAKTVETGTGVDGLNLPEAVSAVMDDGSEGSFSVVWNTDQYQADIVGEYTLEGALTMFDGMINPDDLKAYIVIKVVEKTTPVTGAITEIEAIAAKTVSYGTSAANLNLPDTIQVTVDDGSKTSTGVVWDTNTYKSDTAGTYIIAGTLTLPEGITNPDNLQPSVSVTVNSKTTGGSGGSGGGGGGSASYSIEAEKTENGSIAVPLKAIGGNTVAVTVTPDNGYELDKLTVTDAKGKSITVTEKDGKYTFVMPASKITVTASFKEIKNTVSGNKKFKDIPQNAYYESAVSWAVENSITNGLDDEHFIPDMSCTRAQTVTFLWRAAGSPEPETEDNSFIDVASDSYYYKAVLWAVENGITVGTSDNTFSPEQTVSRAQTAAFLWRMAKEPSVDYENPFDDVDTDAYYYNAVRWAVDQSITNGTSESSFNPNADCTRAQIVTFLYRSLNN